jgi:hypothetical protein
MIKKILWWLVGAFLIFFVAFKPAPAATATRWIGGLLSVMANGVGDFASRIIG